MKTKHFLTSAAVAAVLAMSPVANAQVLGGGFGGNLGGSITGGLGNICCPPVPPSGVTLEDYVGWGSADCGEGLNPAPATSNTLALFRAHAGCQDADNNGLDFSTGAPSPRNSSGWRRP